MQDLNNIGDVEKVEIVLRDIMTPLIDSEDGRKPFIDVVPELIRKQMKILKSKWEFNHQNYLKGFQEI